MKNNGYIHVYKRMKGIEFKNIFGEEYYTFIDSTISTFYCVICNDMYKRLKYATGVIKAEIPDSADLIFDEYLIFPNKIVFCEYIHVPVSEYLKALEEDNTAFDNNHNILSKIVSECPTNIQFIKNKPESICIDLLKIDGELLQYMDEQTNDMCKVALQQNGLSLRYVIRQNNELCEEAVNQNGLALQYVKVQTKNICYAAVFNNPESIQYMTTQYDELCVYAVKIDGLLLKYVKNKKKVIAMEAVKQNGMALQYADKQTKKIYTAAISQNPEASIYIKYRACTIKLNKKRKRKSPNDDSDTEHSDENDPNYIDDNDFIDMYYQAY